MPTQPDVDSPSGLTGPLLRVRAVGVGQGRLRHLAVTWWHPTLHQFTADDVRWTRHRRTLCGRLPGQSMPDTTVLCDRCERGLGAVSVRAVEAAARQRMVASGLDPWRTPGWEQALSAARAAATVEVGALRVGLNALALVAAAQAA